MSIGKKTVYSDTLKEEAIRRFHEGKETPSQICTQLGIKSTRSLRSWVTKSKINFNNVNFETSYKKEYLQELIKELNRQLNQADQAASDSQSEANEHKGAMESRYDTFKEEAQYLSVAQSLRADSLLLAITETYKLLDKIDKISTDFVSIGSFVTVEDQNNEKFHYFIIPYGSGDTLQIDATRFVVIGSESPIAKSLISYSIGEETEVLLPSGIKTYEILDIR